MRLWFFLPFGILLVLFIDLLTKYLAHTSLTRPISILPADFLTFALHKNSGIAFSLPVPNLVQILLTIVLLGVVVWFWKKERANIWHDLGFVLLVGGALGNFVERLLFREVTDFIAVLDFPIFNVADIGVSVGVGCLLLGEFLEERKKKKQKECNSSKEGAPKDINIVPDEMYYCPAMEKKISEGLCWEHCFAGSIGPKDTMKQLQKYIEHSKRFKDFKDFHKICSTCKHCQWPEETN